MKDNFQFSIFNFQFRWILLLLIFVFHVFLRFYDMENRSPFGWDQVDNAWAAKDIIVDGKIPLTGMQVKQNSGFFIGPFYYYFIAPFYLFFNLDPVASFFIAGVTSIISFLILFYIAYRLFSFPVAIIAVFINVVAITGINFDRVQWPVNFIPIISLAILYTIYQIINGKTKYILLLGIFLGISFHIHFTSIVYLIIIALSIPFFPKKKETLIYGVFGIFLFVLMLAPIIVNIVLNKSQTSNFLQYFQTYFHGLHLRRVMQLANDAFIQFEPFLPFSFFKLIKFLLLPLFTFIYLYKKPKKSRLMLCYLMWLYFLVPWFVLSLYRGEISDYYFSTSRFVVLIIISYLLYYIFQKNKIFSVGVLILLFIYMIFNVSAFIKMESNYPMRFYREKVLKEIKEGRAIRFELGIPESYIYYYYTNRQKDK